MHKQIPEAPIQYLQVTLRKAPGEGAEGLRTVHERCLQEAIPDCASLPRTPRSVSSMAVSPSSAISPHGSCSILGDRSWLGTRMVLRADAVVRAVDGIRTAYTPLRQLPWYHRTWQKMGTPGYPLSHSASSRSLMIGAYHLRNLRLGHESMSSTVNGKQLQAHNIVPLFAR